MTNYLLPETDRLAETINPALALIAESTVEQAESTEVGAMAVLSLLDASITDYRDETVALAVSAGFTAEFAEDQFKTVIDGLMRHFQPRIDALNMAVNAAAQRALQDAINSLLENLSEALGQVAEEAGEEESDEDVPAGFFVADDGLLHIEECDGKCEERAEEDAATEFERFLSDLLSAR